MQICFGKILTSDWTPWGNAALWLAWWRDWLSDTSVSEQQSQGFTWQQRLLLIRNQIDQHQPKSQDWKLKKFGRHPNFSSMLATQSLGASSIFFFFFSMFCQVFHSEFISKYFWIISHFFRLNVIIFATYFHGLKSPVKILPKRISTNLFFPGLFFGSSEVS